MPFSESIKRQVQEKAAFQCCRCHNIGVEVHHIKPEAAGGPDTIDNAAPLCPTCHRYFGDNPRRRKQIVRMRNWWYEQVRKMYGPGYVSGQHFSEIYSKLDRIHRNHRSDVADLKRMLETTLTVSPNNGAMKKFVNVGKAFFQPLTKHLVRVVVPCIIIIIVSVLYVGTGVAELVRQNSDDIHMLAAEVLTESGPDFADASSRHAEMLQKYVDHMEDRYLAGLLRLLFPKYSPGEQLQPALASLQKAASARQEEAAELIWQAGGDMCQFHMRAKRFSRSPLAWFQSENLPRWLLTDLNGAFARSERLLDKLEKDLSNALSDDVLEELEKEQPIKHALELCEANRRTMCLLFLGRLGYHNQARIREFRDVVERSHDAKITLAGSLEQDPMTPYILQWAKSERRRAGIVEAMLANDMQRARELFREAIQKAFEEHQEKAS